jgi:hypothetical protein
LKDEEKHKNHGLESVTSFGLKKQQNEDSRKFSNSREVALIARFSLFVLIRGFCFSAPPCAEATRLKISKKVHGERKNAKTINRIRKEKVKNQILDVIRDSIGSLAAGSVLCRRQEKTV